MWSLLSTTKEPFTIPNILPYVHHWQCGLCCPLPKSFTIPNILPHVHHWQCGLCCPTKALLQYLTSYHMSITDNVVLCCPLPKSLLQYLTSYHMSIIDNVVFVVQYQSLLQYLTSYHMSITGQQATLTMCLCCPLPKSFTIPNILPYVHHWQCGRHTNFVVHYQNTITFTIPNILPYVHKQFTGPTH